jgi:hypothetical protein
VAFRSAVSEQDLGVDVDVKLLPDLQL